MFESHYCFFATSVVVVVVVGLAVAAENKKRARTIPQTTCNDLDISHREIFSPYAFSSSTASNPRSKFQDPRLHRKDIPLRSIHLMFLPEKSVPSLRMIMATALQTVAHICFPANRVRTTNHKTKRATYRLPEFHPGGVASLLLALMATWMASLDDLLWSSDVML